MFDPIRHMILTGVVYSRRRGKCIFEFRGARRSHDVPWHLVSVERLDCARDLLKQLLVVGVDFVEDNRRTSEITARNI
ncbi:hypothetical protein C491_13542 [Natronococcus amylolyticus DSM 10524]|uniref:Uncharacterized protein n=1 Tax=Natronococcus amylolyticus DSM 10524 TaxID=1227497 RepID=L9X5W6_9EURY|nr:hypothetical protein C491_13542 [Natronococcus amylolyticus DSM 10524]